MTQLGIVNLMDYGLAFMIGLAVSLVFQYLCVDKLLKRSVRNIDSDPPRPVSKETWERVTNVAQVGGGGKWIGSFETLFFYIGLWLNAPVLIAGWLAFKVAAKWETWNSMIKVPDRIEDIQGNRIDDLEYLRARNGWASKTLTRFLVGTLSNILFAFLGAGAALLLVETHLGKAIYIALTN